MSEPTPAGNWFYGQQGAQNGPVDLATLRGMAASGQLSPNDLVWREGMPDWLPAANVPDVFGGIDPNAMNAGTMNANAGGYATVPNYAPGGPVPVGYYTPDLNAIQYVGFWWRVLATIIDGFVTGIAGGIVGAIVGGVMGATLGADDRTLLLIQLVAQALGILINWLYSALMESSALQATLGKMAIGVRVTNLNGERLGFGRASGRFFAKYLSLLTLGIGFIMVAFTARKQGLHDLIAGTLVLKGRPQG